jgi:hypothetical protein
VTYAELIAQVQDILENEEADFTAALPDFVKRAEECIYNTIQMPATREAEGASLSPGTFVIALPDDFLAPYQLAVTPTGGEFTILENKDYEILREIYPNVNTSGVPRYYTVFDDTYIHFAPAMNGTYAYNLVYYAKPVSLVTASENWLSINAPNALLYATVIEAYRYMKGDADIMAEYKEGYQMAMDNLRVLAEGRDRKDTYRTPNAKVDT